MRLYSKTEILVRNIKIIREFTCFSKSREEAVLKPPVLGRTAQNTGTVPLSHGHRSGYFRSSPGDQNHSVLGFSLSLSNLELSHSVTSFTTCSLLNCLSLHVTLPFITGFELYKQNVRLLRRNQPLIVLDDET